MLLANQRLPDGNQILARMSFREKKILKYVYVQMALPKKIYMCSFCDEILLAGTAVPLFNSYKYSRTPLFRSPKGNGKKFEILAGFRNTRGSVKFITMKHFLIKYSTV